MIWTLEDVGELVSVFNDAGPIDERAISEYIRNSHKRQHKSSHPGVKRWYYLHKEEPRISLCCVGMPLEAWQGAAMLIVGTREIIGEFAGNRHAIGRKGLQMKMQPIAWLRGRAEKRFAIGGQLLAEISEQVLDQPEIEKVQSRLARKYRWE